MIYHLHDAMDQSLRINFTMAAFGMNISAAFLRTAGAIFPMGDSYGHLADEIESCAEQANLAAHGGDPEDFAIDSVLIGGQDVAVTEDVLLDRPFARLLRFERDTDRNDPKLLIVAPMSGNYPTLLRETVESLLPDHDVHVLAWKNARTVPLKDGEFDLTRDYMAMIADSLHAMGRNTHVMGISQSTVPLLATVAKMAQADDPCQPLSMTLIAGPIDTRAADTHVSKSARHCSMRWFEQHFIAPSPVTGRDVCPGFLQQGGFALVDRAASAGNSKNLRAGIDEWLRPTMDSTKEFFLQTVWHVFKNNSLSKGQFVSDGIAIRPEAIRRTGLLTIEGGADHIVAPGQTMAAHFLCRDLPASLHAHHHEESADHYGAFKGSTWESNIAPRVAHFLRECGANAGIPYDAPMRETTAPDRWSADRASPSLARLYRTGSAAQPGKPAPQP